MKTYSRKKPYQKMKYDFGFEDICRLCLSSEGEKQHIFSDAEEVPLPIKIMACVSIEVFEGDGLPAEICQQCALQVENSYKFRLKCESADIKLRQFIKSFKDMQPQSKAPHNDEDCCELGILPGGSSKKGKIKNEVNIKKVLYELLSDVDSSCKVMNSSELVPNPCALSPSNASTGPLVMDCENRDVGLDTSLVQDEDVTLIQNIQNALRNPDCSKNLTSEHCAATIHEEIMKGEENKWEDSEHKDSQRLGEAIAAGFEILNHQRSTVIRLEEIKRQIDLKHPSDGENYLLPEAEHHPIMREHIEKSSNADTVKEQEKLLASNDQNVQNKGDDAKQMSLSTLFQLEAMQETLLFKCDKCPRSFSKRMDLKRHSSVHDEQRGYVCDICEKWFPNKTSIKRHERIHTGERPFACVYCQKRFSQDAILSRHIMTHTGEKPFKCSHCDKGFTQREGLKVHSRQHSSEKFEIQQHDCPLCEKSFCHQSGLSRHLIIHTGKTFDCAVCTKSFTDQSSLRRHLKRHMEHQNKMQQLQPTENIR